MSAADVDELFSRASQRDRYELTIDLEQQTVSDGAGFERRFEIDGSRREKLLHGLDDIALTLQQEDKIAAYEMSRSW